MTQETDKQLKNALRPLVQKYREEAEEALVAVRLELAEVMLRYRNLVNQK